jgi:hypothetical protein
VGSEKGTFGAASSETGHTAQVTMKVTRSTSKGRGMDVETYVPGIGRAFITVTPSAVLWYDGRFEAMAEDLDNESAPHTYRLAVLPEGAVHVFRDGKHLGVRRTTGRPDRMAGARGAYMQWGEGAGASEADAVIADVAYDLSGAYAPGEGK